MLPRSTKSEFIPSVDSRHRLNPSVVDLQSRAVEIACSLGCLSRFLSATALLLSCRLLSDHQFEKNSKKIITLIEIARKTLKAAGIQLYTFSSCPERLEPYKKAYINLLHMLHARKDNIQPALSARMKSLLLSLSACFVILHKDDPPSSEFSSSLLNEDGKNDQLGRQINTDTRTSLPPERSTAPAFSSLMPAPDAFPVSHGTPNQRQTRCKFQADTRLWDAEEIRRSSRRHRSRKAAAEDQENKVPGVVPRLLRSAPLGGRFGIYCTSKSSMHRTKQQVFRDTVSRNPRLLE